MARQRRRKIKLVAEVVHGKRKMSNEEFRVKIKDSRGGQNWAGLSSASHGTGPLLPSDNSLRLFFHIGNLGLHGDNKRSSLTNTT